MRCRENLPQQLVIRSAAVVWDRFVIPLIVLCSRKQTKSRLAQVSLKKLSNQLGAILLQHLVIKSATFATPPFRLTPTSAVMNGSDCSFSVNPSDISWKILPQLDVRFITSPARSPLQTNEMSTSGPCHGVQDQRFPCRRTCNRV